MKKYNGADSKFIGLNLTQEHLKDSKKYKGYIGEKTAVKMYYTLTEEQLKLYHRIHNVFFNEVNNTYLDLDHEIKIKGKEFKKVKIKVLKLKDNFITYSKLLNKVKKGLLDKNVRCSIVSLQDYIKGNNLAVDIGRLIDDMEKELLKGIELYDHSKCENMQNERHNLEYLLVQVIMKLARKFPYYKPNSGSQISSDNIKYYIENDELVVHITDVGGDIKQLLKDYKI